MKEFLQMFMIMSSGMVADWFFVRKPMTDYYTRMEAEHKANMEKLIQMTKRLK